MDDARETRIEQRLRAAVQAAVDAGHFDEAVRISAEADLGIALTAVNETTERVEIFFEAPVVFERAISEWTPPAFVGIWDGPETDLASRAKQILRGADDGSQSSPAA